MEFWTGAFGVTKMRTMPSALADGYDVFVQDAINAEAMGFDAYGAPEHHFTYDGFLPFPLQALSAAAAKTSTIRLVTGAMLETLYDPLEAAEHAATLDVLSGGRVVLGLGMGYRPLEFDGIGTAKSTRGARLRESMEVLRLATTHDTFSHDGDHYRYDDVSLRPTPVQRPVAMWLCGGTTEAAARRAGTAGLPYWLANSPFERVKVIVDEYRKAGREAGWPDEQLKVAAFKDIFLGETMAEAEMMRQVMIDSFYEEHILGYGYLVDDEGKHVYNPTPDHPMYRRFLDSLFCGTVGETVEELKRYADLGVEAVFIPSIQREIISTQIMPEFK
ncbi:MAG: LLM class flavin-dependent oxidoreductase [Acidimicrobiia bacterium]|nr:LLM class flavin-dependent oxidoreductase [Acidimicrobiia bacterium]